MGLLFVCFQADLAAGFLTVQARLNGEQLEEYIKPVGGGYFFVLPGVQSKDDFFAEGLLRAAAKALRPLQLLSTLPSLAIERQRGTMALAHPPSLWGRAGVGGRGGGREYRMP